MVELVECDDTQHTLVDDEVVDDEVVEDSETVEHDENDENSIMHDITDDNDEMVEMLVIGELVEKVEIEHEQ